MLKLRKFLFVSLFLFSFNSIFADETPEDLEAESEELELGEDINEDESFKNTNGINPELQREFLITMPPQNFNLNPHTATYSSEGQILDAIYEGLYSYDPKTLEPKPALATEYKVSRNKTKITYTIRENASFSDGSPINAFSIKASWLMLLSTPNAPYASLLDCVKGAEDFRNGKISEKEVGIIARDNKTLIVNLIQPTAHFNKILCHHAFTVKTGADNVFSGAYVIKERTDNAILLEKNQNYWDSENVNIPSIRITTSEDINKNAWDFNIGKIDWISSVFNSNKILNRTSVRLTAIFGTEYLFFNCKNSPWNNKDFRNALITAVPWAELRKNNFVQATTLVFPLMNYPKIEGLTDTEPEDAKEMMNEARKNAGIDEEDIITLKIGISANSERQKRFFEILKEAWQPLGVDLEAQVASNYRYIESIPTWDADIFVYSWIGDFADPIAFLELFREDSTLNQTKWKNEKYNELLKKSAETKDIIEQYKILAEAEQTLLDDGVVMPISHSISLHAIDLNSIGGWFTNALDIHPYKYLYFKETKNQIPNVVMK